MQFATSIGVVGALLLSILINDNLRVEISEFKQQAFERGHMVECVGREGYYWECEK